MDLLCMINGWVVPTKAVIAGVNAGAGLRLVAVLQ
jgi:hypothetical protein